MSVIRKVPFIESLLGSMSETQLKKLKTIINSGGGNVDLSFATLTNTYKNDVTPVYFHFEDTNVKTAILIWNNTFCALICYHRFPDLALFKLDTAKHTYEKVNEYCDINELRRVLDDTFETKGTIDSGSALANTVPVADGNGGAEWTYPTNAIKGANVTSGDAVSLLGLDSSGNVVKDTIPEGIVVDDALDTASSNAIANSAVADAINDIEDSVAGIYDTTATYNSGDYVFYGNTLYVCKGTGVTGAWDGTKWDLANVGEVLNEKANKDGNYPTMGVGEADVAKNLKAYSSDSGTLQENPFISQGTGTNNNTEIVTTSTNCEFKSKNGNTIAWNQFAKALTSNDWEVEDSTKCSVTFNNGEANCTLLQGGTGYSYGVHNESARKGLGHTWLISFEAKSSSGFNIGYDVFNSGGNLGATTTSYKLFSTITTFNNEGRFFICPRSGDVTPSANDTFSIRNVKLIDLTQMFDGNIPQDLLDNPSHFSWYYNGSLAYNTGSLENANGRYLELGQGRNLFNQETAVGYWDETGFVSANGYICNKNLIFVIPNRKCYYHCERTENISMYFVFYDKDSNYCGSISSLGSDNSFDVPLNAVYVSFWNSLANYGKSTYNHDITISLYYTPEQGGEGYSEHYDYVEPVVVDTGTEVLRSAGSAYDIKVTSGGITRNVGVVDLNILNWTYDSTYAYWEASVSGFKLPTDADTKGNILHAIYENRIASGFSATSDNGITLVTTGYLRVKTTSSSIQPSGNLYYELATPTTEQGTPFDPYPAINDYSYMLWKDTDNNLVSIPQGASIFYPVNYAGTLDDLYSYTDGDVTTLAKKSDLTPYDAKDTILQNAIGGTLRQCLCVKETLDFDDTKCIDLGNVVWSYVTSPTPYFNATINDIKYVSDLSNVAKILSTLYKTTSWNVAFEADKVVCLTTTNIRIKDSTYTDATAFKNAMKGVLLAYEKASS